MKSLLFITCIICFSFSALAQEKPDWTESFQGKQRITWLRAKKQVAERWGINYKWLTFYGDNIQCANTDSLAWIHHRFFTSQQKCYDRFITVNETMNKLHGEKWISVFSNQVDSLWRSRFSYEDISCYPYISTSLNYYGPYCSDSVTRGCIDLRTLTYDTDKIVPPNNFISMLSGSQNNFPASVHYPILVPKNKKTDPYPPFYFEYMYQGKKYKISLADSTNIYYSDSYYGINITCVSYKNYLVFITQPKSLTQKELIVLDPKTKKIITRKWIGPVNERNYVVMDEVCGYEASTSISRYKNLLIVNIDVLCDMNSHRDALHVINLDNFEVKQFTR